MDNFRRRVNGENQKPLLGQTMFSDVDSINSNWPFYNVLFAKKDGSALSFFNIIYVVEEMWNGSYTLRDEIFNNWTPIGVLAYTKLYMLNMCGSGSGTIEPKGLVIALTDIHIDSNGNAVGQNPTGEYDDYWGDKYVWGNVANDTGLPNWTTAYDNYSLDSFYFDTQYRDDDYSAFTVTQTYLTDQNSWQNHINGLGDYEPWYENGFSIASNNSIGSPSNWYGKTSGPFRYTSVYANIGSFSKTNYPAMWSCNNYSTLGTSAGQWHLPLISEIAMICHILGYINATLKILDDVYLTYNGNDEHITTLINQVSSAYSYYLTLGEKNSEYGWGIYFNYDSHVARMSSANKKTKSNTGYSGYVRPFLQIQ